MLRKIVTKRQKENRDLATKGKLGEKKKHVVKTFTSDPTRQQGGACKQVRKRRVEKDKKSKPSALSCIRKKGGNNNWGSPIGHSQAPRQKIRVK